jgi:hypothetical protein
MRFASLGVERVFAHTMTVTSTRIPTARHPWRAVRSPKGSSP